MTQFLIVVSLSLVCKERPAVTNGSIRELKPIFRNSSVWSESEVINKHC